MTTLLKKDEAHRFIDSMPADVTWDDLMREVSIRETIKCGLTDRVEGRIKDVKEIRAEYGLPE
jgi:hypothetical protein